MQMTTVHPTGLGALSIVEGSDDTLVAQGLGSCIGIAAYEPARKIALLAHVMLPAAATAVPPDQPARVAPQAVEAIVREVTKRGGAPKKLVVKIAGGAQVIKVPGMEDRLKIGQRNIAAVHEALAQHGLRVSGEDTGGSTGRTLTLYAANGRTTVRVVGGTEQPL